MRTLLIVATLTLLAGAALAGTTCHTYCGTFAGHRWCNTTCR
jgi:hypothetical protein